MFCSITLLISDYGGGFKSSRENLHREKLISLIQLRFAQGEMRERTALCGSQTAGWLPDFWFSKSAPQPGDGRQEEMIASFLFVSVWVLIIWCSLLSLQLWQSNPKHGLLQQYGGDSLCSTIPSLKLVTIKIITARSCEGMRNVHVWYLMKSNTVLVEGGMTDFYSSSTSIIVFLVFNDLICMKQ